MQPVLTWLSEVEPEVLEWIWEGWIPKGKMTLLGGEAGLGKSFLTMHIASVVSRGGQWPDGTQSTQGKVLLLASEDGLGDTIVPRFIREGGNRKQVAKLEGFLRDPTNPESPIEKVHLGRHLHQFEELFDKHEPTLLIIDPINSYMGGVDGYKNIDVRQVLDPLVDLCGEYKVTILGIHHFRKGQDGELMHRFTGSSAYTEVIRSAFCVLPGKRKEIRRMKSAKMNLMREPEDLEFTIEHPGQVRWISQPPQEYPEF